MVSGIVRVGGIAAFIADADRYVLATFFQENLKYVKAGQPVEVSLDLYPGQIFNGRVDQIWRGNGIGQFLPSDDIPKFQQPPASTAQGQYAVKIYLDDDKEYPTLNGTGTEDYIGTAWGQGKFINNYTGCTVADDSLLQWAFYRFHIPDPVFFKTGCRVAMQQIGGDGTDSVAAYQKEGAPLIPVSTSESQFHSFYKKDSVVQLANATYKGWTNFYRSDDVSAVAYFYLDKPTSNLNAIQPVAIRATGLRHK